jgi:hypothetical protein
MFELVLSTLIGHVVVDHYAHGPSQSTYALYILEQSTLSF